MPTDNEGQDSSQTETDNEPTETDNEGRDSSSPVLSTKRRVLLGAAGAAGVAGFAGCQQLGLDSPNTQTPQATQQQQSPEDATLAEGFADRVLLNGKIVTIDVHEMNADPGTIAEAAAIQDDRFQATGSIGDVEQYVGPDTEVVDLGGKTVVPGFVETHVHPSSALQDTIPDLFIAEGVHMQLMAKATPEATLNKMENYMNQVDLREDEWVYMNVEPNPNLTSVDTIIELTRWTKRSDPSKLKITKEDINELAPNNPMLASISGGRTPSIADNGEIIRVEITEGTVERTYIKGTPE